MKPGVSLLFSMLVGGSILALVLALVGIPDILATLSSMDLKFLVAMFLIALLGRFLIAYRWSCILEAMGHHVPLLNLLWYYFTGFTFGYVLPSAQMGGEPVRAALLKRHDVPIAIALSSVVIDASLGFTTTLVLGSAGLVIMLLTVSLSLKLRALLLLVAALLAALLVVYYSRILSGKPVFAPLFRFLGFGRRIYLLRKIAQMEEKVITFFHDKRNALAEVMLLSAVGMAALFMEMWLALAVIGHQATMLEIVAVLTGLSLAYLVPIPGSMGVQEAAQATAAAAMKVASSVGVALSIVLRIRDVAWVLIGALFLALHGPRTARRLISEYAQDQRVLGAEMEQHLGGARVSPPHKE